VHLLERPQTVRSLRPMQRDPESMQRSHSPWDPILGEDRATGHASTRDVSFVRMQGSAMT
jgi:hypothetical protein